MFKMQKSCDKSLVIFIIFYLCSTLRKNKCRRVYNLKNCNSQQKTKSLFFSKIKFTYSIVRNKYRPYIFLSQGTGSEGDQLSRGTKCLGTGCGGLEVRGSNGFGTNCVAVNSVRKMTWISKIIICGICTVNKWYFKPNILSIFQFGWVR